MLEKADFEQDVVEIFRKNRIDMESFLDLNNNDLLELQVFALGDRKIIIKLKESVSMMNDGDVSGQLIMYQ